MAPGSSSEPFCPGSSSEPFLPPEEGPEEDVGAWGCTTAKFAARCERVRKEVERAEEDDLWRIDSCPKGHRLQAWITPGGFCNGCKQETPKGTRVLDCRECDWYLCCKCQPQSPDRDNNISRPEVADILALPDKIDAPPVCNTFWAAVPAFAACLAFVSHSEGWPPLAEGLLFSGMEPPAYYPTIYAGADGEVMWGPRLGGQEALDIHHRHAVVEEAYLRDPIFPGCGLAARKHILFDATNDLHFSTLMDVPFDGDSLSCHDWRQPVKVPCGWELAPDSEYVVSNVVATHNWSTHIVVFASGNGYGTAGFKPGTSEFLPGTKWTWNVGLGGDPFEGFYANYCMHQVLIQLQKEEDSGRNADDMEKERPVIFDVGAGMGVSTGHFASRVPGARILAFEPMPPLFELLQRNVGNLKLRYKRHGAKGGGSCAGTVLYGGPVSSQGQCQLMCSNRESCSHYVFWDSFVSGNARTGRPWCRLTTSCASRSRELNPRNIGTSYKKLVVEAAGAATLELHRTALGSADGKLRALRYWKHLARVGSASGETPAESEDFMCNVTSVSSVIDRHGLRRVDILKVNVGAWELDVLKSVHERHWPLVEQLVVQSGYLASQVTSFLRHRGFEVEEQPGLEGGALIYATRP